MVRPTAAVMAYASVARYDYRMDQKNKRFEWAEGDRVEELPGFVAWVEELFETEVLFLSDESTVGDFVTAWEIEEDPSRWEAIQRRLVDQGISIDRRDLLVDVYERVLHARNPQ